MFVPVAHAGIIRTPLGGGVSAYFLSCCMKQITLKTCSLCLILTTNEKNLQGYISFIFIHPIVFNGFNFYGYNLFY